jgi:hypothetical protein
LHVVRVPDRLGDNASEATDVKKLDWLSLTLLAANLADTAKRLAPGERITLRRYLQRCLPPPYSREIAARLRARELHFWVDGWPAHVNVLVERASRVLVYVRQGDAVRIVDPDPAAGLN